jgi:polar amino acid transport system substrate-binding protein
MKLVRRQFILLAAAAVVSLAAQADALAQSDVRAELAPSGKLRVILFPLPIIATKDGSTGVLSGVPVDLATELGKRLGVPVEITAADNPAATVDAVKNGTADLTFLVNLPVRAALIDFGPSYIGYEATYLAPAHSPIKSADDVDKVGRRILVPEKSAIDATLGKSLKHAQLIGLPIGSLQRATEMLAGNEADAYSDLHHLLSLMQRNLPGSRITPGSYMTTELQIAFGKNKSAAAQYVTDFVVEMKANGFLKDAIRRAGLRGARVPD